MDVAIGFDWAHDEIIRAKSNWHIDDSNSCVRHGFGIIWLSMSSMMHENWTPTKSQVTITSHCLFSKLHFIMIIKDDLSPDPDAPK